MPTNVSGNVNVGILNDYTIKPKNLTQYTAFRGVTDFTQIAQFNPFETGYSFLSVISMPRYIDMLASISDEVKTLRNSFKHILEYEFRGLQGLPNIEGQAGTITDGINELQYINRVTMDTSVQVSMEVIEKSGSTITKFAEYYLTGIKDRMTQAKTYHGLIKQDLLDPGLENEVFTFLYYVTDNTMLRLERAVLLANAQLTTAELGSLYNSTKGTIDNVPFTLNFNCFPVYGVEVDKAAKALLQDITGVAVNYSANDKFNATYKQVRTDDKAEDTIGTDALGFNEKGATLDSNDYGYGILKENAAARGAGVTSPILYNAIKKSESNAETSLDYSTESDYYSNNGQAPGGQNA